MTLFFLWCLLVLWIWGTHQKRKRVSAERLLASIPATTPGRVATSAVSIMVVTYREGRQLKTMEVEAKTESEAIKALVNKGGRFNNVEKIEKK